MPIKQVSEREYQITGRPGFEDLIFTESSKDFLIWPNAVKFAADQNAVLQSIREAGAFRIQAEGKDDADRYQATRTGAIYFKDNNKFYVAFDDSPNAEQNIILARVREGYNANTNGREWKLSKKDKHIAQILKRAEKSDRIVQAIESSLKLATKQSSGSSKFGSDKTVQALFGDVAEPYAGMLHKRGYNKVYVGVLTPENLDKHVDAQNAIVLPVGLGFTSIPGFGGDVSVDDRFSLIEGLARGVRGAKEFVPAYAAQKVK